MEHLDRRLEHLHELQQPLVGETQAAGVAVGIGIVLGVLFELADIDLTHERGDILIVLVAGLGLGDAHLPQHRGAQADDTELRNVSAVFVHALHCPRGHDPGEIPPGNPVLLFEGLPVLLDGKQSQWRLVDRRTLQRVNRLTLHQLFEPFRQRGFAAAHRSEQVEDLFTLFEPLRGVAEERHNLVDRLIHPIKLAEGGVPPDNAIREEAGEPRVVARIDDLRLPDHCQHPLGRIGKGPRVPATPIEVLLERHFLFLRRRVPGLVAFNQGRHHHHLAAWASVKPTVTIPGFPSHSCQLRNWQVGSRRRIP